MSTFSRCDPLALGICSVVNNEFFQCSAHTAIKIELSSPPPMKIARSVFLLGQTHMAMSFHVRHIEKLRIKREKCALSRCSTATISIVTLQLADAFHTTQYVRSRLGRTLTLRGSLRLVPRVSVRHPLSLRSLPSMLQRGLLGGRRARFNRTSRRQSCLRQH